MTLTWSISCSYLHSWKATFKITSNERQDVKKSSAHWPFALQHLSPLDSPQKGPLMRKAFPCHDVIITNYSMARLFMTWWHREPRPLHWRQNGRDSVSNHQPHDCLLNRLFRRRSKKTSKLRVTGLCAGNSPGTGEFPAQMASNAENVFIRWRLHALMYSQHNECKFIRVAHTKHPSLVTSYGVIDPGHHCFRCPVNTKPFGHLSLVLTYCHCDPHERIWK